MKTIRLNVLLVLMLITGLFACKKDDNTPTAQYAARQEMNVTYGNASLQKMDVYFPEGYNEQTPVVFLIHGGGFIAGTKEEFTSQAMKFRAQGFVTVNLSHRLVDTSGLLSLPPVHKPSAIKVSDELADIDAAVKKYQSIAPGLHGGTGRMYMAGHSAGAILSMLYVQGNYNNDLHIRASGNWAGVTDLSIPHDSLLNGVDPRLLELYYRASGAILSTSNNLYYMAISPYWVAYNAGGGRPNISIFPENNAIFNTTNEVAYNLANTQNFHTMLRNHGVAEKLSIYAGEDHGFGTKPGSWDQLIVETANFFKAH